MTESPLRPIDRLLAIMARLRDREDGCEWDLAQDFRSIAPYTIEEAYEVADAIARHDMTDLRDELGDLLLQVVFHSRMAEEAGHFDFQTVATGISEKMERRHPHIFGEVAPKDVTAVRANWEAIKAAERQGKAQVGALDGVAMGLPALLRAEKLQKRAARVGFDWPDAVGAGDKLREEIGEFEDAEDAAHRLEEAGDMLFAMVNWLRKHDITAEDALLAANRKFERRFRGMEVMAIAAGEDFASLDLSAQDGLWNRVKSEE
ncbi:nucleoside triphosphate pyrophosphohydrolase [Croceicoccus ponticola]|uniref:Nucleoside triphosphate pyrophosphohydrolase n=1 Tax=Croceicoccus ponticola TaxID=2217664 RepID=A0A437H0Q1_9SPHN|nr:nucleoside triphosphate pyrophosphohydrolase [Croceicoccus ponticola]RVQ69159.1 nucleoside triphosphate pyrophosphohydrolase [Croceicoccus ponticola]